MYLRQILNDQKNSEREIEFDLLKFLLKLEMFVKKL